MRQERKGRRKKVLCVVVSLSLSLETWVISHRTQSSGTKGMCLSQKQIIREVYIGSRREDDEKQKSKSEEEEKRTTRLHTIDS